MDSGRIPTGPPKTLEQIITEDALIDWLDDDLRGNKVEMNLTWIPKVGMSVMKIGNPEYFGTVTETPGTVDPGHRGQVHVDFTRPKDVREKWWHPYELAPRLPQSVDGLIDWVCKYRSPEEDVQLSDDGSPENADLLSSPVRASSDPVTEEDVQLSDDGGSDKADLLSPPVSASSSPVTGQLTPSTGSTTSRRPSSDTVTEKSTPSTKKI